MVGAFPYLQISDLRKEISRDKHSSLFILIVNDKEKKLYCSADTCRLFDKVSYIRQTHV